MVMNCSIGRLKTHLKFYYANEEGSIEALSLYSFAHVLHLLLRFAPKVKTKVASE